MLYASTCIFICMLTCFCLCTYVHNIHLIHACAHVRVTALLQLAGHVDRHACT